MKKARLLIALLALLVAASCYAQDSYRQAVKDYLVASGQFDKSRLLLSDLSMLFDKNGPVDIDQLTKRYLDEQFENDIIEFSQPMMTSHGITEDELKEVSSLLSKPENKTFEAHQQDWMGGFLTDMLTPFMRMGENLEIDEDMEADEDMDLSSGGLTELLGPPVEAKADIDAAYAEKFRQVMLESPFVKNMLDTMLKRFHEFHEDPEDDFKNEAKEGFKNEAFNDWMNQSFPNLLLNNAYGTLTLEDIDFANLLYTNDAYCKVFMLDVDLSEEVKTSNVVTKYMEWMEQQGAKKSEDPGVVMEFFKSLMNLSGLDLDNPDLEDIEIEE